MRVHHRLIRLTRFTSICNQTYWRIRLFGQRLLKYFLSYHHVAVGNMDSARNMTYHRMQRTHVCNYISLHCDQPRLSLAT